MTEVRIEHYDSEGALRLKEPVLAVYLASRHDQQHDPWFSPGQFWQRLVELYARSHDARPGRVVLVSLRTTRPRA